MVVVADLQGEGRFGLEFGRGRGEELGQVWVLAHLCFHDFLTGFE